MPRASSARCPILRIVRFVSSGLLCARSSMRCVLCSLYHAARRAFVVPCGASCVRPSFRLRLVWASAACHATGGPLHSVARMRRRQPARVARSPTVQHRAVRFLVSGSCSGCLLRRRHWQQPRPRSLGGPCASSYARTGFIVLTERLGRWNTPHDFPFPKVYVPPCDGALGLILLVKIVWPGSFTPRPPRRFSDFSLRQLCPFGELSQAVASF